MINLRRRMLRYGAAVLAVSLAAVLARLLQPLTPTCSPLFLAAVAISTWYGGLGSGLLATALSTLALDYLVIPPAHSLFAALADVVRLGMFGLVAVLIGSLYTSRRRAEDAVTQALAREHEALAEAEAANRHKDQFLTCLGHELRTPLATIRNVAQVLGQGNPDATTLGWGRELLDRQVQHMGRLLEDLLEVSRIGRGQIDCRRERLDLAHLLRTTAEDLRGTLEEPGLAFRVEVPAEPVWAVGDPTRLAQVVSNLLGNAGKFTDAGGTITLRLTTSDDGQWAAITVRDTGLGIEPEMLPRVFDLFVQSERTRDRSRSGLGLGLALVRGLVELHGGTVSVASEGRGRGTEFTVWLPLRPLPEEVEAGVPIPEGGVPGSCMP